MSWGYHLLLDLSKCEASSIRNKTVIRKFSRKLVKQIDMIPYKNPIIVHFGKDDKMGFTLVQLIETSNISAHFCECTNDAYIDIFSCKEFDKQTAVNLAQKVFKPQFIKTNFILRNAAELK